MRGNWSTGGPVADSAKGQQINVEHGRSGDLSLHSTTTPAWNIADRIVKEEIPEDKNNDSGVSPGHYTSNSASPRSRRSSSTANGSLSPGSASSQDSSAMQYDYSPQSIFKSCVSPLGFSHANGNRSPKLQSASYGNDINSQGNRNNQNKQPVDMVSSTMKPESDDSDTSIQCPICPFNTVHRMQFDEHLQTVHYSPKQCAPSDYTPSSYTHMSSMSEDGARGSPSQGDRSEHEFDDTDEPGLRVPRVNCQGKIKVFKCKQCSFTATTKLAFWEHARGHIKAEKLLTCPRCPFVTEYKHHLEYHLKNHFNSKPFKCEKCPYSCVNKSMLNSHLKSHSNVYQYRCADCSYATKYCHSLKLHLRKYVHKPAMVLNPDGSPNPLPIIDVYGTRRGPKQKTAPKTSDDVVVPSLLVGSGASAPLVTKMAAVQSTPSLFSSEHNLHAIQQQQLQQQQAVQLNVPFSYSHIFNAVSSLPARHLFQQFQENNNHCNDNRKQFFNMFTGFNRDSNICMDDYNGVKQENKRVSPVTVFANSNSGLNLNLNCNGNLKLTEFESSPNAIAGCAERINEVKEMTGDIPGVACPLDLSKPEITTNSKTNSPRAGGTSRRKGRAFKLDKLPVAHEDSEDEDLIAETGTTNNIQKQLEFSIDNNIQQNNNKDDLTSGGASDYNCQYCDIAFGNVVMYTMHMGYHGYKDPYTCNMCGHECADKVSFFLHIARDSHS